MQILFSPPTQPVPQIPPTLQLRCFNAPTAGPTTTLRVCVETLILPEREELSKATLQEYETTLSLWERYTLNPPIGQIARSQVKEFRQSLIDKPFRRGKHKLKRSPATVNKIMRTLASMITPFWPADRTNPGGHGFLPFFEMPKPLRPQKSLPFTFNAKDMSQLYLAAEACAGKSFHRTPKYNPFLWRTAMVLALNTGPRTWDLFDLEWTDVNFDDFKYGSVHYRAQKTGKFQRPPLNRCARAHLERLKALRLDPVLVFPGFHKAQAFYTIWKRIVTTAGLVMPNGKLPPFEAFRKTCSTLHDDIFPGVGAWLTGHEVQGVNARNYQNPTQRVLSAVYQLKNPAEFRRGAKALLQLAE